jgi:Transport and Golgi organisation 2
LCSIIIINQHHKEFPLIIAANRDEDYNRPTSKVQILSKDPFIVGGRDELKGGTWLAINKHSLFVGITNQGERNDKLESRGSIVIEALKCSSIEELLNFVEDINPKRFNGFNLIFGNQSSVFVAYSYLIHSMVIKELPKGINVITNDIKFNEENSKASYVHKKLDLIDKPWLEYYATLKKILNYYGDGVGLKIKPKKKDGKLYGNSTVSSSILAFDANGLARYKYYDRTEVRPKRKEGEPFVPRYVDYIDLWREPVWGTKASSEEDPNEIEDGETEELDSYFKSYFKSRNI